ncbi:hypothetical protein ACFLZ3_01655 [Candidatus Omnitrophota bacterium]
MFKRAKLIVLLLFIFLTAAMTYPLIFRSNSHIPGFFSTDEPYAMLWDHWRIKNSIANNSALDFTDFIAYPYGVELSSAETGSVNNLWKLVNFSLAAVFNPPLGYNLQVLINMLLCGFLTYLLVYFLTQSNLCGVISGIAFAFCPYQFVRSWQHLGSTYNQWLALTMLSLFLLKNKDLKSKALFLISIIVLFSFDYYLALFTLIALGVFLVYLLIYNCREKTKRENRYLIKEDLAYFKRIFLILLIAFIILLPQHYPLIKQWIVSPRGDPGAFNPYYRPFEDLFSQSARPLSYFLPASVHPVFGKFTEFFVGSFLYGDSFTEHSLYLGWTVLILAFVAFRKRKKSKKYHFYIGFFLWLAIASWLFSQPPWWKIGPIKIFMPSFFLYKVIPTFRAYCRFGIVLMLAVAVLAGFGLKFILGKFKTKRSRFAITALFCGLVLFEFWNYPPFKVIDVSKTPEVYRWLKQLPQDIVIAEYPLDADSPNEVYKFYQTEHEKKMINGTIPGTHANKISQTITKLSDPDTGGILKSIGVKYVVVHRNDYLESGLVDDKNELTKISLNPGLKLVKSFSAQQCQRKDIACTEETGQIDVYEVVAASKNPEAIR